MATRKTIIALNDIDDLLDLKRPWLAALLGWLIPGAGQIYQGRTFKGVLFCVCILGMFFCGVQMGEGRPVYCYYEVSDDRIGGFDKAAMQHRNYGYISQFLVGLPAMPALIQSQRFNSPSNTYELDQPLDELFEGVIRSGSEAEEQGVAGTLSLQMDSGLSGPILTGRLLGTLKSSGESIDLELSDNNGRGFGFTAIGRKIAADPERFVSLEISKVVKGPSDLRGSIQGTIPRPFYNWFQVPLQDIQLQDMNARLGKRWELAMVFTWIAGLLNILAIWDAFEGPAYGLCPLVAGEGDAGSLQSSQASGPGAKERQSDPGTASLRPEVSKLPRANS